MAVAVSTPRVLKIPSPDEREILYGRMTGTGGGKDALTRDHGTCTLATKGRSEAAGVGATVADHPLYSGAFTTQQQIGPFHIGEAHRAPDKRSSSLKISAGALIFVARPQREMPMALLRAVLCRTCRGGNFLTAIDLTGFCASALLSQRGQGMSANAMLTPLFQRS